MPSKRRKHYQLWTNDARVIGIMERIHEEYPKLKTDSAVLRELIMWFGKQSWGDYQPEPDVDRTLSAQTEERINVLYGALDKLQSMLANGASVQQTTQAVDDIKGGVRKWGAFEDGIENAFEELDFEGDE